MRRVVITGLGMVAPTGNRTSLAWDAALQGKTGVGPITLFDPKALPVRIAAEVKNFDGAQVFDHKELNRTTRFVLFAGVAANEACEQAGLKQLGEKSERWGCCLGVGIGALRDIEDNTFILHEKGARRVSPFFIPYAIANMAAGVVAIKNGLAGPNLCTTTACASGTHAVGEGLRYIRDNYADIMVCGGAESAISPLGITSFSALKALSTENDNPEFASRPFDLNRDGFVMGEGAGVVVLEELEHAKKRGAKIFAELVGYGLSCDAFHITAPGGDGGLRAMKMALQSGRVNADEMDYINAHGTSTKLNDQNESLAIAELFGSSTKGISISSTKGVTGHCLGAAGGIEAVYTALAVHHQVCPPTAGLMTPDPDCPLDYTPHKAKERKVRFALSNSFGFGGTNACIVMKRFTD